MSELISEELFDQFRTSTWPRQFSSMAQAARAEGVPLDELSSFSAYESGVIIAPKEDKQMLKDMGIVEDRLSRRNPVTPSMVQDGFRGDPNDYIPRYSDFGKEVIMACENLFTPEEHAAASEAARPELERRLAEVEAEFGPLE